MKKLTKLGIDALKETLPALSRKESAMYMGNGDRYKLLANGSFQHIGTDNNSFDTIVSLDGRSSITVDGAMMCAYFEAAAGNGGFSMNVATARPFFEFMADNTFSEWVWAEDANGVSYIYTDNDLINVKMPRNDMEWSRIVHSHQTSGNMPSPKDLADCSSYEGDPEFYIYEGREYHRYY